MQTNEFQEDANIRAVLDYFIGVVKRGQGLGRNATNTVLLTGLSSIFKDSSLQVRSPHREYNTGSSTTVYLTILQDRLHTLSSSLYICVCTPQDLVVFSLD